MTVRTLVRKPTAAGPRRGLRRSLLILLLLLCVAGAAQWWRLDQRHRWLERATLEELAVVATGNENDVEVFERLGVRAREGEQWGRAAKAFQRAVELAPDRVDNWIGWARCIYEIDGFRTADMILSEYLRSHPKDGKAYLERAGLRRVAKRREMAAADVVRATELLPVSGEAWALRGDLALDQGLAGEAEIAFNRARTLMPNGTWPLVGLYQTYIQIRKMPEALEMARGIVMRFPTLPEGPLYLAEATIENARGPQDYEAAREALREARKRRERLRAPDQFALEFLTGRSYFEQGRWRDALPFLERANDVVPDNPDMLFQLGRTYRALGNLRRADLVLKKQKQAYENISTVRRLTARILDDPRNPALRLELARWYVRVGAPSSASVQYEEMIARGLDTRTAERELKALEDRNVAAALPR